MKINLKEVAEAIQNRKIYKAIVKVAETRVCITLETRDFCLGRHKVLGLCLSARDIITGCAGDEIHFPESDEEALDAFKGFIALLPEKLEEINHFQK